MHVDTPQTICLAGVARRDVTPPVGIYHRMWGAATHDRSTGVHRPLACTVLALAPAGSAAREDASATQCVIAIDHCLLWNDELAALTGSVARRTGLDEDQLQVSLSHTHAAGLMDRGRGDLPGGELIGPYLDELAARVGEAVEEAIGGLQPATIVYGRGSCTLAAHRDLCDPHTGRYVCGFNPAGPADDTLLVGRVSRADGQTLATIVNYACHPTTLAWDNTLVSPDYVGAMREVVERATGAACLFLQGASGDLGPRRGFVGDVEVADRNGRELGYAALAALEALPDAGTRFEYAGPVISGATIGTWRDVPLTDEQREAQRGWQTRALRVPLRYRADLPTRELTEEELARWMREEHAAHARGDKAAARDCRAQVERMARQLSRLKSLPAGDSVPVRAAVWRLGDAVWVFVAGEHYQALQTSLRARHPERTILVTTITGGWLPGYVPAAETYGQGIYQESIALVAPGSLERLIDVLSEQIGELAAICK